MSMHVKYEFSISRGYIGMEKHQKVKSPEMTIIYDLIIGTEGT